MVRQNPFKPTAGATPPLLVGRSGVISDFAESLDDGPGAPARLAKVSGARGVGKTVMLTATANEARSRDWLVITETATSGLAERLTAAVRRSLTPQGRIDTDGADFRTVMERALDDLEPLDRGVLITIDEVHDSARASMKEITTAYQHLVTAGRNVALVFAGLPNPLKNLLDDDVLTFLRRAEPFDLDDVPLPDVQAAFLDTITAEGRTITDEALAEITLATGGYPFMIQLVGYHVWRVGKEGLITIEDANIGIPAARKRLGTTVHSTALNDASPIDRTFLLAMSHDDGPSKIGDIGARLDEDSNYITMYRSRLLNAGLITSVGYGLVDFALPYMRDYLRENAAHIEMAERIRRERTRRPGKG